MTGKELLEALKACSAEALALPAFSTADWSEVGGVGVTDFGGNSHIGKVLELS